MRWLILVAMILIGVGGWRLTAGLSSDAAGLALGLFLGLLAIVPTLLMLAVSRQRPQPGYPPELPPVHYHDDRRLTLVVTPPARPQLPRRATELLEHRR